MPAWRDILEQPAAWYGSAEAREVAAAVLAYQLPDGGWPKNHDMTRPPGPDAFDELDERLPTIDNGATHTQLRLLSRVDAAQPDAQYERAIVRGIDYLLEAQYANGGWPQFYPLRRGYYTHITFNDDAMVGVLGVLRSVERREREFAFIDEARRARAADAVQRGIACILRCQIVQDGLLTAWCAQHDEQTFAPAKARAYEHPSLSGLESVGITRFLMGVEHPSPGVVAAVEGAVAWFQRVRITGLRLVHEPNPSLPHGYDSKVVEDPAAPALWARFYELGTSRPLFSGRDSVMRYSLAEVEPERRGGYRWYIRDPAKLLERDYPAWVKRVRGSEPAADAGR